MRQHYKKIICAIFLCAIFPGASPDTSFAAPSLREQLDAPLLFAKRHSYQGIHIYDTYYQWHPGGGIYVLENPCAPPEQQKIRPVIDPTTPETLGEGIYSEPELSWDATRLLFCFKGTPEGHTSIHEIGVDGKGLRQLTFPAACVKSPGRFVSQHDVGPAYLPDGRIIFTSTRLNGLVPCFNTGVDILHVMDADGANAHVISVNNVNEFDPTVLPDGRVLYGRWEYVDKTALTQQTLWTIFPDGTNETALYANNLVRPEAFLDARPVPGAGHLIAASFTRHNGTPRGSIGIVDTHVDKNSPAAITNFDHPDDPTVDLGDSCEPWPLSSDVLLFSGRAAGAKLNAIEIRHRDGRREPVLSDPDICLHSPMLVKPRPRPPVLSDQTKPGAQTGQFFVQDIYQGMTDVARGDVKQLRIIEETSRASGTHGSGFNQLFVVSAALAFGAKNYLGVVPVEPDGSAYFEVPSGRAIYLQALDSEGRMIHSMRTFVQASPGVTRSCIGCHEHKFTAARNMGNRPVLQRAPDKLRPESWGSGYVDYPGKVQVIFDRHCVSCHGGEKGIAASLDLSGGWTEYFNISYENLANRRTTQVVAELIAAIDCMNGTANYSAQRFPPRSHGSGAAPLAEVLVSGHKDRIKKLTRTERDQILAWIDTNGLYYGSWDYSDHGVQLQAWLAAKKALESEMRAAGCGDCHEHNKKITFETDWINLTNPKMSRILRAPLAKDADGFGLGMCRDRKTDPKRQRLRMLFTGDYVHSVLPLESFKPIPAVATDSPGEPLAVFASNGDRHYQNMLAIIEKGRREALATPRIDMPGAVIHAGVSRRTMPVAMPDPLPALEATIADSGGGGVRLSWERSARTIGLSAELHRGERSYFAPGVETLLSQTELFQFIDGAPSSTAGHYALVLVSETERSAPIFAQAPAASK